VITLWISEGRGEDEPERNVFVYTDLACSMKVIVVSIHVAFVCRSDIKSHRICELSTSLLKAIKLDIFSNNVFATTHYDIFNNRLSLLDVLIYNVKEGNSGPLCCGLISLSNTKSHCKSEISSISVKVIRFEANISNVSFTMQSDISDKVLPVSGGDGSPLRLCCAKYYMLTGTIRRCSCSFTMVRKKRSDHVTMSVGFQIIKTRTVHAAGCIQTRRGSQWYLRLYETNPVITMCLMCNILKCQ
jgi:hypothetical protein